MVIRYAPVYRTKMMLGKVPGMDTKRSEIQSTGKKKLKYALKGPKKVLLKIYDDRILFFKIMK